MNWFHICFSFKLEALQILKYNPGRICFVREQCGIILGKERSLWGLVEVGRGRAFHFPSGLLWDPCQYFLRNKSSWYENKVVDFQIFEASHCLA